MIWELDNSMEMSRSPSKVFKVSGNFHVFDLIEQG